MHVRSPYASPEGHTVPGRPNQGLVPSGTMETTTHGTGGSVGVRVIAAREEVAAGGGGGWDPTALTVHPLTKQALQHGRDPVGSNNPGRPPNARTGHTGPPAVFPFSMPLTSPCSSPSVGHRREQKPLRRMPVVNRAVRRMRSSSVSHARYDSRSPDVHGGRRLGRLEQSADLINAEGVDTLVVRRPRRPYPAQGRQPLRATA